MATYVLSPGREKSLLHRHPWVFSGAIASIKGEVTPGATVDIMAEDGRFLGRAAASPASQIRARIWSFDPNEKIDAGFFERRLARPSHGAIRCSPRATPLPGWCTPNPTACRA